MSGAKRERKSEKKVELDENGKPRKKPSWREKKRIKEATALAEARGLPPPTNSEEAKAIQVRYQHSYNNHHMFCMGSV